MRIRSLLRVVTLPFAVACAGMLAAGVGLARAENAPPAAPPAGAAVIVAKAANACFSDLVRVTGFVAARRIAVAGVDSEGGRVAQVLVREGDRVSAGQDLARLIPPGATQPTASLKAPAAGLVTEVRTRDGAPASPQAGPLFRIAVNGDLELDAEVPSLHLFKLNKDASARITLADDSELAGKVRQVAAEVDPRSQLGHVRLTLPNHPGLRLGQFARAAIVARRSCGIAVPRAAIDHQSVQVVKDGVVESRPVQTGLASDSAIEILAGIADGELVVANADTSLHAGDRVRAITAGQTEQPPASRP
jgi:multidrug efflux pump subunit AcrA (membrane-fusion protein)